MLDVYLATAAASASPRRRRAGVRRASITVDGSASRPRRTRIRNLVLYERGEDGGEVASSTSPKTSKKTDMTPRMFARDNRHPVRNRCRGRTSPTRCTASTWTAERRSCCTKAAPTPARLLLTPDEQDRLRRGHARRQDRLPRVSMRSRRTRRLALATQKAFPGQCRAVRQLRRRRQVRCRAHVFSDRNPGDFYLFDIVKKNAEYIGSARKWIDPEQMAAMQPVRLKAGDGLELNGYSDLAAQQRRQEPAADREPRMAVRHGPRDVWGFNPEVQLLASRGLRRAAAEFPRFRRLRRGLRTRRLPAVGPAHAGRSDRRDALGRAAGLRRSETAVHLRRELRRLRRAGGVVQNPSCTVARSATSASTTSA